MLITEYFNLDLVQLVCNRWDRFWEWISLQYFCSNINVHLSPPVRAMLLYLCWNEHIERQADVRYQIETIGAREVCALAGFPVQICTSTTATAVVHNIPSNKTTPTRFSYARKITYADADWQQYYYNLTWNMLEEADKTLAMRVLL